MFFISSQSQSPKFLDSLLKADLPNFSSILNNPDKYKLQIIYTQINRDKNNNPSFTDYKFKVTTKYIYPASTIKLPVSLLALIKLEELNKAGLSRSTKMVTDSGYYCQKQVSKDLESGNGYPSIETYIKKMFLVSDNVACARTYEFVGHDYAHTKLAELGYKNIRLFNRLDGSCPGDTAKITPPVYFINENKDTLYKQPLTFFTQNLIHPVEDSRVGRKDKNGQFAGKNFSKHNYFAPADLHDMMRKIVFNDYLSSKGKMPISTANREFMLKHLGMYPKESDHPAYDKKNYYDSFKKYFLYGSAVATISQDSIRMYNIVGRAYGFLIDCAYIVDFRNNIEYLLTACIYVNEKGKFNGKYEYDLIGLPFLKELSWSLYNYESKRKKTFEPDLKEFERLMH